MKTKVGLKLFSVIIALVVLSFHSPAFAEESVDELKQQIQALQQRVDQLESSTATKNVAPANQGMIDPWDPFAEMYRMQEQMDRIFQNSFVNQGNQRSGIFNNSFNFSTDIDLKEVDDGYEVVVDMAGLDENKIDIEVNEHALTVKGEHSTKEDQDNPNGSIHMQSFGTFMKTIPLPADADSSKMKTEKTNDKLIIRLPKK